MTTESISADSASSDTSVDGRDPFAGAQWSGSDVFGQSAAEPIRRRRRSVSVRRLRRRRRTGLMLTLLGAAVVLIFGWLLVTGLLAHRELAQAQTEVRTMRTQIAAGDFAQAQVTARRIAGHAADAHGLTTGPVWASAAALPGAAPLRTARGLTATLDRFGHNVLPSLVSASSQLDVRTLRSSNGQIDLNRIAAVAPALDRAVRQLDAMTKSIAAQPAHTWFGEIDSARTDLLQQVTAVQHTLRSADLAAHIAPPMLGHAGVRRYFVAFQNEAEARGTGGVPGAFGILRTDDGKLSFERFVPDTSLLVTPVDMHLGAGYDSLFRGTNSTTYYVNSNLSPNFPYAAQTWLAMWQKRSGERLDGAIALDPTVLSYLLRVTGPARMADGTKVTSGNVVALTQSTVYAKFAGAGENSARKRYLVSLAGSVSKKILSSHAAAASLVRAAGTGAGERRVLVYSTAPAIEKQLAQTSLAGVIPTTREPYAGMSVVNNGGNKLDYYLDRSLRWQAQGCGSPRSVAVTMTLRNNAPPSGLPAYVRARSDAPGYPVRPGDNSEELSYYATSGAVLQSASVNGAPVSVESATDLGHPVFVLDVEVPRGATTTVVLQLTEPSGNAAPTVLRQPLVRPLQVTVDAPTCASRR